MRAEYGYLKIHQSSVVVLILLKSFKLVLFTYRNNLDGHTSVMFCIKGPLYFLSWWTTELDIGPAWSPSQHASSFCKSLKHKPDPELIRFPLTKQSFQVSFLPSEKSERKDSIS